MTQVVAGSAASWKAKKWLLKYFLYKNLKTVWVNSDALVVAPILTFLSPQIGLCLCSELVKQCPICLYFVSCWLKCCTWTSCCIHGKWVRGCPVVGVAVHQASNIETKGFCHVYCRHVDRPLWVTNIAYRTIVCWFAVLQFQGWWKKSFQGSVTVKISPCFGLHGRLSDILPGVHSSQVLGDTNQFVQVFWGEASALPPADECVKKVRGYLGFLEKICGNFIGYSFRFSKISQDPKGFFADVDKITSRIYSTMIYNRHRRNVMSCRSKSLFKRITFFIIFTS